MIHQKATHECDKCGHTTDGKELFNELGEALGFEMDEEEPGDRDEGVPKPQGEGSRSALITPSSPLKEQKEEPTKPTHPSKTVECPECDYKGTTTKAVYQHCWIKHKALKVTEQRIKTYNTRTKTQKAHRERVNALNEARHSTRFYDCPYCPDKYVTEGGLESHIEKEHKEDPVDKRIRRKKAMGGK